jgi:hypothetical protein
MVDIWLTMGDHGCPCEIIVDHDRVWFTIVYHIDFSLA